MEEISVKLIFLGDSNVGKTNIINTYLGTNQSTQTTIAPDFHSKIITLENKEVKLQMWDTAG